MPKTLKLFILTLLLVQATYSQNLCPQFEPYCSCDSITSLTCENFENFSELNFNQENDLNLVLINELKLVPLNPIGLDNSLNLTGLELNGQVTLANIKSFEFNHNPFLSFTNISLILSNSTIYFKSNNKDLSDTCTLSLDLKDFIPIFSSFKSIIFEEDIIYPENMCPLIFLNSEIEFLQSKNLSANGFDFKNLNMRSANQLKLNSNINVFNIFAGENLQLSALLFDENVFLNTYSIEIDHSSLKLINDDTFSKLQQLQKLTLNLLNMEEFITSSKNKNKWMKSLNYEVSVNLNDQDAIEMNLNYTFLLVLDSRLNDQDYVYPEKHLGYFKTNFPHERVSTKYYFSHSHIQNVNVLIVHSSQFITIQNHHS
jgi:hypothetical protein